MANRKANQALGSKRFSNHQLKAFYHKRIHQCTQHITQLILVALTIIIRGFFYFFFKKNVKLATKTIKTQAKKEERKK